MIGYSICAAFERSSAIKRPARLVLAGIVLIFATFAVKQVILGAYTTTAAEFDELPAQSLAANGLAHWRPVWANDGTFDIPQEVAAGGRGVTITRWEPTVREFEISPGAPVQARAAIMYYPLWQASVNGEPADTRSTGGALAIDVGPQLSNVMLRFVEPAYTGYSRTVSLFAWLAVIVTLLLTLVRKSQIKDYPEQ
jgi:hypothetical protein